MKTNKKILTLMILFLGMGFTACGKKGFSPQEVQQISDHEEEQAYNIEIDTTEILHKVDEAVAEVENNETIQELSKTEISIFSLGKLKLFKDLFSKEFGGLADRIGVLKEIIAETRSRIEAQIALMDPSIPSHADAIKKLEDVLARLGTYEEKLGSGLNLILDKIDEVDAMVDGFIDKIGYANPLLIPVVLILKEIKSHVTAKIKAKVIELLTPTASGT